MRLHYLDSLRGFAVCGVVLIHAGQIVVGMPDALAAFAAFGFRGVQLFFIVSALTLCLVTRPETFVPARFYVRRFFRIAPMFYLAGAFYLTARWAGWFDFAPQGISPLDVASTALFVHGLVPSAINNVVPGGWSIASEAIFYALFPVALFHIRSLRAAMAVLAISFAIAAALIVLRKLFAVPEPLADFYNFNFLINAPAFAAGIVLYHILLRGSPAPNLLLGNALAIGVLGGMVCFAAVSDKIPGAQVAFIPVLATLALVVALYRPVLLTNRVWSWLGEVSFSLYLVHFAVLHVVAQVMPRPGQPWLQLVTIYTATLGLSAIISTLTFHLIERPMVKIGQSISTRLQARPLASA